MRVGLEFKGEYIKGLTVRIDCIKRDCNILEVTIFRDSTSQWQEKWNLEHTILGFNRFEYIVINPSESNRHKNCQNDYFLGDGDLQHLPPVV